MSAKPLQFYFLVVLIAIASVLFFFIFRPFLVVLMFATVFAVVLQPLYRAILRRMSGSPGLAAFATLLISVVCVLVPLTFLTIQITNDAKGVYASLSNSAGRTYVDTAFQYANGVTMRYIPNFTLSSIDPASAINTYMKDGLTWLVQNLGGAFGGAARLLLDLFVFMIALYYLLRDGAIVKQAIIKASPLADVEDNIIFAKLELAIRSLIRGSFTIALIQGVLTGIGFALFGVPHSILWGVAAAFAALIPGIGTSLVLAPGIVYLFIIGAVAPATGLLIWGVVAVGMIDNFLGPRLMGKGTHLHPLVVLLSVFGGLALVGPAGVFLGPLCTSFLFALLSIYQHISRQTT